LVALIVCDEVVDHRLGNDVSDVFCFLALEALEGYADAQTRSIERGTSAVATVYLYTTQQRQGPSLSHDAQHSSNSNMYCNVSQFLSNKLKHGVETHNVEHRPSAAATADLWATQGSSSSSSSDSSSNK
jgi:hypothetical protein